VHADLAETPLRAARAMVRDGSAGGEFLDGEGAGSIVLLGNGLQDGDAFGVFALADEELGRLLQADDGYAQDAHDEDERARREPHVAPAHVVGARAGRRRGVHGWVDAGESGDEGPGEEAGDELADTCFPPISMPYV